jgi:CBS domain-containing protein
MTKRRAIMPVWEVMTPSPLVVKPETTVAEALGLFERHDFNAFPVVEAEGVLRGLLTKLDLLRLFRLDQSGLIPALADLSERRVEELMRHGVVTVEPDERVAIAADLMAATGLRSLPVVNRSTGRPVLIGMLSRGDLLRGLRVEAGAVPRDDKLRRRSSIKKPPVVPGRLPRR